MEIKTRFPAVFLNIGGFLLSLFVGGLLYLFYGVLEAYEVTYQQTYYPTNVFLPAALNAWEYGWAAIPLILFISLFVGLILGSQKRDLARI